MLAGFVQRLCSLSRYLEKYASETMPHRALVLPLPSNGAEGLSRGRVHPSLQAAVLLDEHAHPSSTFFQAVNLSTAPLSCHKCARSARGTKLL
jgi:hypothetical protein